MTEPEVWLRGALPGYAPQLQPAAHSLLQCREEVAAALHGLTPAQLWARPFNVAAVGFHARHAVGSLDRLFSYARGEQLSAAQRDALAGEGIPDLDDGAAARLIEVFNTGIERALEQARATDASTLLEPRAVGRARLPSTVIGLLFHAAEHTQRHSGQLVTTAKIVRGLARDG